MLNNKEKIDFINNRISHIDVQVQSLINNEKTCLDKYNLQEELDNCDIKKNVLLSLIDGLKKDLTNLP